MWRFIQILSEGPKPSATKATLFGVNRQAAYLPESAVIECIRALNAAILPVVPASWKP